MTKTAILVVDDNSAGRYLKTRILRGAGYLVAEAPTAEDALRYLEKNVVQVAVLDVKLPDMHGFELCRVIKERFPGIGVLQTSATFTTPEDRVAGLDFGADAYLVEPMEETELVATVRALLRVRQAEASQRAIQRQFARFAQASPDVLWIYDADNARFEYVSPSLQDLFGLQPEDVIRNPTLWFSKVDPAHRDLAARMLSWKAAEEEATVEYRIDRPDGSSNWIRDKAFILPGEPGQGRRIAGLARDISESKRAEQQRELLISELNHRVKNTLAIVQSLAAHTMNTAVSPTEFEKAFISRLHALAKAHDLLTQTDWKGATLRSAIESALSPFASGEDRINMSGPPVLLGANTAVTMALAFHELATNAAKYGAFSVEGGRVDVVWQAEPPSAPTAIDLLWRESGGPETHAPTRKGFGSTLLGQVLSYESEGETKLSFPPEGLQFRLRLPLSDKVTLL